MNFQVWTAGTMGKLMLVSVEVLTLFANAQLEPMSNHGKCKCWSGILACAWYIV
jgi:hypothetical protein